MRFIRESTISTPSLTGSAPPLSPEPAPRATQGTYARRARRTIAWTCSVVIGSTAAAGVGVVLQQPVGLVGAQLVLSRVDPLVADDPRRSSGPGRTFQTTIHDNTAVDCR